MKIRSLPRHSALRRPSALILAGFLAALLGVSQSAEAAARTWVGSASTDWAVLNGFNTIPVSGDSLVFGADGAAGTGAGDILTNTLTTSAFNVAGITFNAGAPAYTMTGNTFNLTTGINNGSANLQTFSNTGGLTSANSLTFTLGGGITITNGWINTNVTGTLTQTFNGAGSTATLGGFNVSNSGNRLGGVINGSGNVNITGNITGGNTTDNLTYSGTGTLTIGGGFAFSGNGAALNVSSGTVQLTSAQQGAAVNVTGSGSFVETSAGSILNTNGAFGGFNQNSTGTSILSGTNTYQNATQVNNGTLLLDFSATAAPTTATNIINSSANSSALTLGGGTLSIKGGGAGATNSQRFNGTTLTAATSSRLNFTQNGATSLSATLGNITRNAASVLDITLPSAGTVSTTSTTFATNSVLVSAASNGVAYATVNGGAAFASNTAGTLGAITPVAGTYGATANVSVGAADAPASDLGANTLTFNGAANTVTFTGTNAITTGGILVSSSATGASTITGGTITGGGGKELTVFNYEPTVSGSLTISSIIADNVTASALTIAGVGTTILNAANTFSGQTTLLGGTLNLSNQLALQNSALQVNAGSSLVFDQSVSGNAFTVGALQGTGNISLINNAGTPAAIALTVGNSTGSYSGILSGTGATLTKTGTGTQTLSGANTYTGGTTINAGTVIAGSNTALGTGAITLAGGRLSNGSTSPTLGNAIAVTGTTGEFTTGSANNLNLNGAITGSGTFTVGNSFVANNAASVVIGDNLNGFSGTVNFISSAVDNLIFNTALNTSAKFTLSNSTTSTPNTQFIRLNGGGTYNIGGLSGTGASIQANASAVTLKINQSTDATFGGLLTSNNLSVTKASSGSLTLTGTNTYVGATTITGGILSTGATGILANGGTSSSIGQSTNAASKLVLDGGTLQYANTGAAESTDRLFTVGSTVAGATGTLDASGTNAINFTNTGAIAYGTTNQTRTLGLTGTSTAANTLAPLIGDNGTGAVSVTKSGTGSWTLTGANTYTGGTSVNDGTLQAGNTITANTYLGAGNVTVQTAGTLTLNAANIGALNMTGNFALNTGGTLSLDFTGVNPGEFDQFNGTGSDSFAINGGTIKLSGTLTDPSSDNYLIFSNFSGNTVGTFAFDTTGLSGISGYTPVLSNLGVLSFTAVPEPSTTGLVCVAALGLLVLMRRRQRMS